MDWENLWFDLTSNFLSGMVDVFFREVQTRGAHRIPKEGPVFFVGAPHANQMFDPLVLSRNVERRIFYLCAQVSYNRAIIGHFARLVQAIPVARPQDYAVKGFGKITVLDRIKAPLTVTGIDTKFTSQLSEGMLLALPQDKGSATIEKVVSDTELILKKELKNLEAIEMLSRPEGCSYKCLPQLDQSAVYKFVYKALNKGGAIGIFPEGGSHDRSDLLPLKAGVAVMTLGAMAANPELDVKLVPCGLNYFHPDKFRSRAVVDYGKPITVPKNLIELFKKGGEDKRKACGTLLNMISDALKAVTITAPDLETLMVVQAARRLYQSNKTKTTTSQVVKQTRLLLNGYLHFKDEPQVVKVRERILKYNTLLQEYGVRDHQVRKFTLNPARAAVKFVNNLSKTVFMGLLALPYGVLNAPIIATASVVSKRKQAEALANSTVKVTAKDVVSTWKLLITLGLGPTLYFAYSSVVGYLAYYSTLPWLFKLLAPVITFLLLPLISFASLQFGDRAYDASRTLRPLFLTIIGDKTVQALPQVRQELSEEITSLIHELGPKVYPEIDLANLLQTEVSEEPGSPGMPPLTPSSQSALNWIMTPLDFVGEKFFDFTAPSTPVSLSRPSSSLSLHQSGSNSGLNSRSASSGDLTKLHPLTKISPEMASLSSSNQLNHNQAQPLPYIETFPDIDKSMQKPSNLSSPSPSILDPNAVDDKKNN